MDLEKKNETQNCKLEANDETKETLNGETWTQTVRKWRRYLIVHLLHIYVNNCTFIANLLSLTVSLFVAHVLS